MANEGTFSFLPVTVYVLPQEKVGWRTMQCPQLMFMQLGHSFEASCTFLAFLFFQSLVIDFLAWLHRVCLEAMETNASFFQTFFCTGNPEGHDLEEHLESQRLKTLHSPLVSAKMSYSMHCGKLPRKNPLKIEADTFI